MKVDKALPKIAEPSTAPSSEAPLRPMVKRRTEAGIEYFEAVYPLIRDTDAEEADAMKKSAQGVVLH